MFTRIFFLFTLFTCHALFSAAPVFHLWVAERLCTICNITEEETIQAILIGAEFPDIRYITNISRERTHPFLLNIAEVFANNASPFTIGKNLHAWTDIVRENAIEPEVYAALTPYAEGHSATLLKLIEDEILAEYYDGRQWSPCFDEILEEELAFTKEEMVWKWHTIIQWSISIRPSYLIWVQSYLGSKLGVSAETLYKWSYLIPELAKKTII